MAQLTFGELVGLMVCGRGVPDTRAGLIRRAEDGAERHERVIRSGVLVREETDEGRVRRIVGRDATWYWDVQAAVMRVRPHERDVDVTYSGSPIGGLDVGGQRPSWSRWDGTDFTRPSSRLQEATFLGRPCHVVELAPPSHKPYPLRITVDAATGLVLRTENEGFGLVHEWVEVEIGGPVPEETFVWSGPVEPLPTDADERRTHHAHVARGRAWLAARGVGALPLPAAVDVTLHDWDDTTGAFYAGLESRQSGVLLRRPASGAASWEDADATHYDNSYRWADPRWDWFLGVEDALPADELARLKARLGTTS